MMVVVLSYERVDLLCTNTTVYWNHVCPLMENTSFKYKIASYMSAHPIPHYTIGLGSTAASAAPVEAQETGKRGAASVTVGAESASIYISKLPTDITEEELGMDLIWC